MKKLKITLMMLSLFCTFQAISQVAINKSGLAPHSSAILDVDSDTLGFLLPSMTKAQRDAINSPATGLMVFITDDNLFYYYDGSDWQTFDSFWTETTTSLDRVVASETLLTIKNTGKIGIGESDPQENLHILEDISSDDTAVSLLKLEGNFAHEFLDSDDIVGINFEITSQANGVDMMQYAVNGEGDAIVAKDGGNLGIGKTNPNYRLDVAGNAAAENMVTTIPLWQGSEFTMSNTSGQDIANCESAIIPTVHNANGDIDVKLVIRVTSTSAGNNSFQLRTHNGTTEVYPIVVGDTWTWSAVSTGYVVESEWKSFAAGTSPMEAHLFGWLDNGQTKFNSVYLLIRPHQN